MGHVFDRDVLSCQACLPRPFGAAGSEEDRSSRGASTHGPVAAAGPVVSSSSASSSGSRGRPLISVGFEDLPAQIVAPKAEADTSFRGKRPFYNNSRRARKAEANPRNQSRGAWICNGTSAERVDALLARDSCSCTKRCEAIIYSYLPFANIDVVG